MSSQNHQVNDHVLEMSPSDQQERVWQILKQQQHGATSTLRCPSDHEKMNQKLKKRLGMLKLRDGDGDGRNGKCPMLEHQKSSTSSASTNTNTSTSSLEWPSYKTIMDDISSSDYNRVLESPHDMLLHPQCSMDTASMSGNKTFSLGKKSTTLDKAKFTKAFCPHGTVCCAKMELFAWDGNDGGAALDNQKRYTGLLTPAKTVEHCIIRLSSAMKPPAAERNKFGTFFLKATGGKLSNAKLFPMVAIKAFRHNYRSGNLLFAGRKIGQSSVEFFRHCLCTQMTERVPTLLKPFIQKFYSYSINPLSLGVSDFCQVDESGKGTNKDEGQQGKDLNFPYVVMLNPVYGKGRKTNLNNNDEALSSFETFDEFINDLLTIPSGTVLFDIFACPDPHSALDGTKIQRIGRIISTSEMIVSTPHDGLFFRHQKKEEDFELHPEWREQVKATCSPDGGKTVGTIDRLVGSTIMEQLIDANQFIDFERTAIRT